MSMPNKSRQNSRTERGSSRPDGGEGNSSVATAKINAKYALIGVVVTAVIGTLGTAVVSNWDKLFHAKPSPQIPNQVSSGPQSPNISAQEVHVQYGSPAEKPGDVGGDWRTSVLINPYDDNEKQE